LNTPTLSASRRIELSKDAEFPLDALGRGGAVYPTSWWFVMTCKGCLSNKQSVFSSEIAIHFPGREGLDKPMVFVFPKLVVCLQCGLTVFAVPERELQVLEHSSLGHGAAVLPEKVARPLETTTRRSSPE